MNPNLKGNLNKLIEEYNPKKTTSQIRESKHSERIRADIQKLLFLRKKYSRIKKTKQYKLIVQKQCDFLYKNYLNIFNRLLKEELDIKILYQFLDVLKKIENKELDQHEGSYEIGSLLKKMYIDPKIKKKSSKKRKKLSWNEWEKIDSQLSEN